MGIHTTAAIQVLGSDADALRVERVFVAAGELRATISSVECRVGTNEILVAGGVVFFQPIERSPARHRLLFSKLIVRGLENLFWCIATDARLVNATSRFNVLKRKTNPVAEQQLWP